MNLTNKQWLGVTMVVIGVIAAGGGQLSEIIGPTATKGVVALAGLVNSALGGILVVITGQGAIVQEVRSMPGVENIEVNRKASPVLASLATDPSENKISSKVGDERAIQVTANT